MNIPHAEHKAKKREEKRGFESHQEMAGRHGKRAEQDRAAPAKEAIGEEAAEDWREINRGGVGAEDGGGERLPVESAIEPQWRKRIEDPHMLDVSGQEEILDHVKDKQRLHAVVGEAFPRLGEGEKPKPARMAKETRRVCFALSGTASSGSAVAVMRADGEVTRDQ